MASVIKFFYTVFTAVSVFFTSLFFPATLQPQYGAGDLSWLEYPAEAVCSLAEAGLTPESLCARADAKLTEYIQSKGYDDINGVFLSPYYTAEIGNNEIPVYSAMVFNRSKDTGDIHSFSEVYVDSSQPFSFNIRLAGKNCVKRSERQ